MGNSLPENQTTILNQTPRRSMHPKVKMVDLGWQYEQLRKTLEPKLLEVLRSGRYIGGEAVSAFEAEFAAFHGVSANNVCSCANGSDALYLALRALGIKKGDEVVTVPNSFVATAHAIERCGARALFVDVDPELHTMRVDLLHKVVTSATRAILPVHLYGHPVDMGPLLQYASELGLCVVEDCAQACGAEWNGRPVGALGDAGCFSFFPTKTLGAAGDGGMVICRDEKHAIRVRSLAHHGFAEVKNKAVEVGVNSRLDAIQAVVLSEKLKVLNDWNERRRAIARIYSTELASLPWLTLPREASWGHHVYHLYVVQVDTSKDPAARDAFRSKLLAAGIDTQVHYQRLISEQMPYRTRGMLQRSLAAADALVDRVVSLPIHPGMTTIEAIRVCQAVKEAKP